MISNSAFNYHNLTGKNIYPQRVFTFGEPKPTKLNQVIGFRTSRVCKNNTNDCFVSINWFYSIPSGNFWLQFLFTFCIFHN